jgi:hypothetical protein
MWLLVEGSDLQRLPAPLISEKSNSKSSRPAAKNTMNESQRGRLTATSTVSKTLISTPPGSSNQVSGPDFFFWDF